MAFPNTHQKPDALWLSENHFKRHADIRRLVPHHLIRYGNSWPFFFNFNQGTLPANNQSRPMRTLKESKCKDARSIPDDVTVDILARLPVKSILKLRSVCRFWYSHTHEQHFIQQHMQMNKPNVGELGIIAVRNHFRGRKLSIQYFANGIHEFDITPLYKEPFNKISNSCDGLICIYGLRTTYLMNPSIKEVVILPPVKRGYAIAAVALVKIASTGEYKIVRTFSLEYPSVPVSKLFCEVFDGSTYSWRQCPCLLPVSSNWLLNPVPVVVNEAIHWIIRPFFEEDTVVSFDVSSETINVIKKPEGFPERFLSCVSLVDCDGCLCIVASVKMGCWDDWPRCKELWVLKDRENLIWERICIPAMDVEPIVYKHWFRPVVVRNGVILRYISDIGVFAFYDIEKSSSTFVYTRVQYHYMCAYNESLISPASILERNLD